MNKERQKTDGTATTTVVEIVNDGSKKWVISEMRGAFWDYADLARTKYVVEFPVRFLTPFHVLAQKTDPTKIKVGDTLVIEYTTKLQYMPVRAKEILKIERGMKLTRSKWRKSRYGARLLSIIRKK